MLNVAECNCCQPEIGVVDIFKPVLHLEPEPAVSDCWAKGAVPKIVTTPRQPLVQVDVDVLGSGDATISAALSRRVSQAESVFTVTDFL